MKLEGLALELFELLKEAADRGYSDDEIIDELIDTTATMAAYILDTHDIEGLGEEFQAKVETVKKYLDADDWRSLH